MPRCRNCGNTNTFVLFIDFAARLARNPPRVARPDRSIGLQCPACDSTDVDGAVSDLPRWLIDR